MSHRDEAIKQVAAELEIDVSAVRASEMIVEHNADGVGTSTAILLAVAKAERCLVLEEALRKLIERHDQLEDRECTKHDFYCCIEATRAALEEPNGTR